MHKHEEHVEGRESGTPSREIICLTERSRSGSGECEYDVSLSTVVNLRIGQSSPLRTQLVSTVVRRYEVLFHRETRIGFNALRLYARADVRTNTTTIVCSHTDWLV